MVLRRQDGFFLPAGALGQQEQDALRRAIERRAEAVCQEIAGNDHFGYVNIEVDAAPGDPASKIAEEVAVALRTKFHLIAAGRPPYVLKDRAVRGAELSGAADTIARLKDLGRVRSMGSDFSSRAGGVIDELYKKPGDKGKLQLNVNIPVVKVPGLSVGFEFLAEPEREQKKVKLAAEVGANVTGKADIGILEVFARAQIFGLVEAVGDSGKEVFDLISFAMYKQVSRVNQDVASWIWDFNPRSLHAVQRGMDAEDYVHVGAGVGVQAGIDVGRGDAKAIESQAGYRQAIASRFDAQGRSEFGMGTFSAQVEWTKGVVGEVKVKMVQARNRVDPTEDGRVRSVELEVAGTGAPKVHDLAPAMLDALMIRGLASASRRADASKDTARASSGVRMIINKLLDGIPMFINTFTTTSFAREIPTFDEAKLGVKLTLGGKYEVGKGVTEASITLERTSAIEVGDNSRAMFYAAVERSERIHRWTSGG